MSEIMGLIMGIVAGVILTATAYENGKRDCEVELSRNVEYVWTPPPQETGE